MKVGKILLLFLIVAASVILFGSRGILDNTRLNQKLIDLRKSNGEIVAKNDTLKNHLDDPRVLAKIKDVMGNPGVRFLLGRFKHYLNYSRDEVFEALPWWIERRQRRREQQNEKKKEIANRGGRLH